MDDMDDEADLADMAGIADMADTLHLPKKTCPPCTFCSKSLVNFKKAYFCIVATLIFHLFI